MEKENNNITDSPNNPERRNFLIALGLTSLAVGVEVVRNQLSNPITGVLKKIPSLEEPISSSTSTPESTSTVAPTSTQEVIEIESDVFVNNLEYPKDYRDLPVIPTRFDSSLLNLRNLNTNSKNFSVVGDCQTVQGFFLPEELGDPNRRNLGGYDDLYNILEITSPEILKDPNSIVKEALSHPVSETIEYYREFFNSVRYASKGGLNAAAVQNPFFSFNEVCKGTSPIDCELRERDSVFTIVQFEEAWASDTNGDNDFGKKYIQYTSKVVEKILNDGSIPLLVTSTSDKWYTHTINNILLEIAKYYKVPIFNLYNVISTMPNKGLNEELNDGFHLSGSRASVSRYDFSQGLPTGWAVKNASTLGLIHVMRFAIEEAKRIRS